MIRLLLSDPLYAEMEFILTLRARFMNPACHFDLCGMPEVERLAMVATFDSLIAEMFQELSR